MAVVAGLLRKSGLEKWSLPIFLTKKNKNPAGLLLFTVAGILYMSANHFHFIEPKLLPMSWLDEAIPFVPQTMWIYISEYIFYVAVYLTCKDLVNLNKYFYSFLALYFVSSLIFWVWPTTYPRDNYPLPTDLDPLTFYVFSMLRITDTPANCCPSLHVSSIFLSVFIFLDEQRKKLPFFLIWGAAIALSTLPTKQHYIVDVVAGLAMAWIFYWIFHRFVSYRPWPPSKGRHPKR